MTGPTGLIISLFRSIDKKFIITSMSEEKILITKEGLETLKAEYGKLKEVKRPALVERLYQARLQGDLAENSEYVNAKEELSFVDDRVDELGEVLKRAEVVDQDHVGCREVKLGCRVTVKSDRGTNIFHLVGEWESKPAEAKISHQSPLGQSLMGKKVGERVKFSAPAGEIVYTVIKIDWD